jgi:hypothetical protein
MSAALAPRISFAVDHMFAPVPADMQIPRRIGLVDAAMKVLGFAMPPRNGSLRRPRPMEPIMIRHAIATLVAIVVASAAARSETITFEQSGAAGAVPSGFSQVTTGRGAEADWRLQEAVDAPSGKMIVQQRSTGGDMRFPVLVYDKIDADDIDLSVKFKAVAGKDDQAAGLVWRLVDANNYYVVRANALEDNVVTYIVKDGRRIDLPVKGKGRTYGAKVPVTKGGWNTLAVSVRGPTFKISLNGQALYEVEDKTFAKAGKVALWTKADSVMQFDDFVIEVVK